MTLRRLFIALVLCFVAGLTAWWIAPKYGIAVPWYTTLIAFAVIFVGTVITTDVSEEIAQGKSPETPDAHDTEEQSFKIEEFEDRRSGS